jgi:hypothetical protein
MWRADDLNVHVILGFLALGPADGERVAVLEGVVLGEETDRVRPRAFTVAGDYFFWGAAFSMEGDGEVLRNSRRGSHSNLFHFSVRGLT